MTQECDDIEKVVILTKCSSLSAPETGTSDGASDEHFVKMTFP